MKDMWRGKQRFSIRRFSVGAASVLVGTFLLAGPKVGAEEVTTSQVEDQLLVTRTSQTDAADQTSQVVAEAVPVTAPVVEELTATPVSATPAETSRSAEPVISTTVAEVTHVPTTAPVEEEKPTVTKTQHRYIRYLPAQTEVVEDATVAFGQEVETTAGQRGNRTWTAKLYQAGKLLKTQTIQNATVKFFDLVQDAPYEVETSWTYDIGNGNQTEVLSQRTPLEINLKALEFQNIQKMTVYRQENGKNVRVLNLPATVDLKTASNYHLVLETDLDKEVSMPLTSLVKTSTGYKGIVAMANLVEKNANGKGYHSNFEVDIPFTPTQNVQTDSQGNKIIYQFADLIQQLQHNPAGRFVLGADLTAQGFSLASAFTGKLDGRNFKIYDLVAPLFHQVNKATISNLHLADVNIEATTNSSAPLAIQVYNQSLITNMAVDGRVSARYNSAGLINQVEGQSQVKNVAIKAKLKATAPYYVGGILGKLASGSLLEEALFDGTIELKATAWQQRAGAIIADVEGANTRVRRAVAKGTILNHGGNSQVGGVFGTVSHQVAVDNVISTVNVKGGTNFLGDKAANPLNITNAFVLAGQGETSIAVTNLTEAAAQAKVTQLTPASQQTFFKTQAVRDYSRYYKARTDRAVAYCNMEKLMPFYNSEYIVHQGNQLADSDKLTQTALLSVVAMKDKEFVTDYFHNVHAINGLLLNYADGSSETLALGRPRFYQHSPVLEYEASERGLIYTPEQFLRGNIDWLVRSLASEMASMSYFDDVLAQLYPNIVYDSNMLISQKIKMSSNKDADKISNEAARDKLLEAKVDPLYLEEAFKRVTPQLETYLTSLVNQNLLIVGKLERIEQTASIQKIKNNKAAILLGLAYMERLYNIQFDDYNIKNLAQFRQDVFGKKVDGVDFLIQLGKSGLDNLRIANNAKTYASHIGNHNGQQDVFDYLDAFRSRLTNKSNAEWLRTTTKAYVVEKASQEPGLNQVPTDLYTTLSKPKHRYLLLPLLAVSENTVFVITNMSTVTFGMFEREVDRTLATTDPATYQEKLAKVKANIQVEAERQRVHFDLWSRLVDSSVRSRLHSDALGNRSRLERLPRGYWR